MFHFVRKILTSVNAVCALHRIHFPSLYFDMFFLPLMLSVLENGKILLKLVYPYSSCVP